MYGSGDGSGDESGDESGDGIGKSTINWPDCFLASSTISAKKSNGDNMTLRFSVVSHLSRISLSCGVLCTTQYFLEL